jgi:Fe-S cluster assembly protein SufB
MQVLLVDVGVLLDKKMEQKIEVDRERYDFKAKSSFRVKADPGINEKVVRLISREKNEPEWMLKKRLQGLEWFKKIPLPNWGPSLNELKLNELTYYLDPESAKNAKDWDNLPDDIKKTFEKLGIPEAERKYFAGAGAQFESQGVYHNLKKQWEDKGVIFCDCDTALQEHEKLFKKYFMTSCVPISLHKFAALHAAVWSGGSFIYVPENVNVDMPLQAYFRMNEANGGQFEHTLIIIDKNSNANYIEGCSSPRYDALSNLHAGCVEIHVKEGARARYSSIENWSTNTYNLNTKRAIVDKNGIIEWINGNNGSKVTMLYPTSILKGENAKSDYVGIAYAGKDQEQDTGHKVHLIAPNTSATVTAKSICKDGGITNYRGAVDISKNAINAKVNVQCDALMMDNRSKSNTYPSMNILNNSVKVEHEAKMSRISEEQLFYLMSRGLTEEQATQMIVSGFIEPISKELPMEYAIEFNRLIQLEMEGSLG